MARKSRWQQFADNFNSVYGTFNEAFRKIETKNASSKVYENEDGTAMTGLALERARANALADIYTKYGDPEKGLALRASAEGLGAQVRDNDVGEATRSERIFQEGAGASGLMRAQTNSANASATNSYSQANARDVMLPNDVGYRQAQTRGLSLGNDLNQATFEDNVRASRASADREVGLARQAASNANVSERTEDAQVRSAEAGAANDEAVATTNQVVADTNVATADANIEAKLAELRAVVSEAGNRTRTAEQVRSDEFTASEIIAEGMAMEFETPEELNAWVIEEAIKSDMSPKARLDLAETLNKTGVEAILARGAEIKSAVNDAWKNGGLDGLISYYESVQDGVDIRTRQAGDRLYAEIATPDGRMIPLASAAGENADAQIAQSLMARLESPAALMAIAAADLETQQARANVAETQATTGLRAAQTQETEANTRLLQARADEILLSMDASKTGPAADKDRNEAVIRFSDSPEIQYLLSSDDPAERDRGFNAIADFERVVGHKEAPPPDIPGSEWYALTPSERKEILALRAGN